jgi:hypothetical protein
MEIKSKIDRLLKFLDRIAITIILATIALSIIFVFGYGIYDHFRQKADEVKIEAKISDKSDGKSELTLKVGNVQKYGNLWVANIEEPKDSYRVGYGSTGSITRNLLITPENSDKVHLLFDSYKNKFSSLRPFPDNDSPKVFLCTFIKNFNDSVDEDEDEGKISLMLLSADGEKQKTILEGIDRVLKVEMNKGDAINVIYFKEGKLINANFSIKDFKSTSQPAIFDLKDTDLKNSKLLISSD